MSNADLLKAIRAIQISDNPKTRATLYDTLLAAKLLIPLAEAPEGDTLTSGQDMSLVAGQTPEGQIFIIAFTDQEALLTWSEGESIPFIEMPTSDFFPMLAANDPPLLVLNVAGPVGGEFTPTEIRALAQGRHPTDADLVEREILAPAAPMEVTAPLAEPTPFFMNFLSQALAQHAPIETAYLFTLHEPVPDHAESTKPTLVAGVNFVTGTDPHEQDRILRALASKTPHNALEAIAEPDFSFAPLSGDLRDHLETTFEPFYQAE